MCEDCSGFSARAYILNLVLLEVWNVADNKPGQASTEVDELVHQEGHDTGSEDVILHPSIPGGPQPLSIVEVDVVLGYLVELTPVGLRGGVEERGGG